MTIIVTKETAESGNPTGKYKAYPKDRPDIWGLGYSMREAVGALIVDHPCSFGITVEYQ